MAFQLPVSGFVFWPVGTGDSTTIVVDDTTAVLQVDLHHLSKAEDDDEVHVPIVDELVRLLPKRDGRPYLAGFALTHPDKDHVLGFTDLLERVDIGQIWHTPRIFREYEKDLCDDAAAFKEEVERRRDVTMRKGDDTPSGDRVLVIGHDDVFAEGKYVGFPGIWRAFPGKCYSDLDGTDHGDAFQAFIHAPFKDGVGGARNETSLALHVTVQNDGGEGRILLFGDLSYPNLRRILDKTKEKNRKDRLDCSALLAPHHCSKSAMYFKGEDEDDASLKQDIMDDFDEALGHDGRVIASCDDAFSDQKEKNPPHLKARRRYEEIVADGYFICTHQYGGPISFRVDVAGCTLEKAEATQAKNAHNVGRLTPADAIRSARGRTAPPTQEVGFGRA
jgi:beta-lactamase superfamily II metal-dependent hydrolase